MSWRRFAERALLHMLGALVLSLVLLGAIRSGSTQDGPQPPASVTIAPTPYSSIVEPLEGATGSVRVTIPVGEDASKVLYGSVIGIICWQAKGECTLDVQWTGGGR